MESKREVDFQDRVHHRRQDSHRKTKSKSKRRMHRNPKEKSDSVGVTSVPSWEKEFCYKIGQFTWENFLKAKRNTKYQYKVLEWDDEEAEQAFRAAKSRFFAETHGLCHPDSYFPSPDLYIDDIHWDEEKEEVSSDYYDSEEEEDDDDDDEEYEAEEEEEEGHYISDYYYIMPASP